MGFNFRFLKSTPKHLITKESVFETFDLEPKRICFNTTHKNALKKTGYTTGPANALYIPFENTIKSIYNSVTDLNIHKMKNSRYWGPINNDNELSSVESFVDNYKEIVFLRDEIEVSCAISEYCYFDKDGIQHLTKIGDLEKKAKYSDDSVSIQELSTLVKRFIDSTPYYNSANCICGVPSSKGLPSTIADLLSSLNNKLEDLSRYLSFEYDKVEVKNKKDIKERWAILENANLQIGAEVKNKKIILLDDMYQTGITMQYIAMKLLEAGASKVYSLSLVKSASNSL